MVSLRVLSDRQKEEIFSAALNILEEHGINIQLEEVAAKLEKLGATTKGDRTFLPSNLVRTSLRSTPTQFNLQDSSGGKAFTVGDRGINFGAGVSGVESNSLKKEDDPKGLSDQIVETIRLGNELGNFNFIAVDSSSLSGLDEKSKILVTGKIIRNSDKPLIFQPSEDLPLERLLEVFHLTTSPGPTQPGNRSLLYRLSTDWSLVKSKRFLKALQVCADGKTPVRLGPSTKVDKGNLKRPVHRLTLAIADLLSSLTILQVMAEGSPVIVGAQGDISLARSNFLTTSISELAHNFGLPVLSGNNFLSRVGMADKAIFNSTFSYVLNALANADAVSCTVPISTRKESYRGIPVIYNEIIGMINRILSGVSTNEEDLALDLIHEVGPKGDYLMAEHTLDRFRSEHWQPEVIDRQNYEGWEKGGEKRLMDRACERAGKLLSQSEEKELGEAERESLTEMLT